MARLRIGRRNGDGELRVVVLLRGTPAALEAALPGGVGEVVGGAALVLASFVRRGRVGRFLARDHLAWLCGGVELGPENRERRFSHEADRFSVALTVLAGEALELELAAEACSRPDGSVFASARAASEFLDRMPATRADEGRVWEPLAPTTARWCVPGLAPELQETLEFDSAYRQVARRLLFTSPAQDAAVRGAAASVRALPSP
jgi:hypothetical protein